MKAAILVLALLVSGCGAVIHASGPRSVALGADNAGQALTAAEAECGKHGRHAQLRARDGFRFLFDCVQ